MVLHVKSMEASTAGVWGPKYASYTVTFGIGNIIVGILTCSTGLFSFSKATPFGVWGGPERTEMFVFLWWCLYALSPRIRLANWMSFGMMVTCLAWIAHRLVSSNSPMR